jgi:hypothetical protein
MPDDLEKVWQWSDPIAEIWRAGSPAPKAGAATFARLMGVQDRELFLTPNSSRVWRHALSQSFFSLKEGNTLMVCIFVGLSPDNKKPPSVFKTEGGCEALKLGC